jgi:hypothetical protein
LPRHKVKYLLSAFYRFMRTIIICTKELSEYEDWAAPDCYDKKFTNYTRIIEVKDGDRQIVFLYCPLVKNCGYWHSSKGEVGLLYHHNNLQIPTLLGQIGVQNPVFQIRCGTHEPERDQYEALRNVLDTDGLSSVFDGVWSFFFNAVKLEKNKFLKSICNGEEFSKIPTLISTPSLEAIFEPLRNIKYDNSNPLNRSALTILSKALLS